MSDAAEAGTQAYGVAYHYWQSDVDVNYPCLDAEGWQEDLSTTGTVKLIGPPVPRITGVAVTSTPSLTSSGSSTPDTYGRGEEIGFTVTFDYPVNVSGDPRLPFSLGNATVHADYESGSGSTSLVFTYTVKESDEDTDGIALLGAAESLDLDSDDAVSSTSAGNPDATIVLTGSSSGRAGTRWTAAGPGARRRRTTRRRTTRPRTTRPRTTAATRRRPRSCPRPVCCCSRRCSPPEGPPRGDFAPRGDRAGGGAAAVAGSRFGAPPSRRARWDDTLTAWLAARPPVRGGAV